MFARQLPLCVYFTTSPPALPTFCVSLSLGVLPSSVSSVQSAPWRPAGAVALLVVVERVKSILCRISRTLLIDAARFSHTQSPTTRFLPVCVLCLAVVISAVAVCADDEHLQLQQSMTGRFSLLQLLICCALNSILPPHLFGLSLPSFNFELLYHYCYHHHPTMLTTREVHLGTSSAYFFPVDASEHHYENIDVDSLGRCASELITFGHNLLGSLWSCCFCCELKSIHSLSSFRLRRLTLKDLSINLPFLCVARRHRYTACPSLSAVAAAAYRPLCPIGIGFNQLCTANRCQGGLR